MNALERNEIRAVRVGGINYYDPDDLEALRLKYRNKPLPGWASVKAFATGRGRASRGIVAWLERNNHEVRKYLTSNNRFACYARPESLEAWAAQYRRRALAERRAT